MGKIKEFFKDLMDYMKNPQVSYENRPEGLKALDNLQNGEIIELARVKPRKILGPLFGIEQIVKEPVYFRGIKENITESETEDGPVKMLDLYRTKIFFSESESESLGGSGLTKRIRASNIVSINRYKVNNAKQYLGTKVLQPA